MIEWRRTAGGAEIAEFEDMTCVLHGCKGAEVLVLKGREVYDSGISFGSAEDAKRWFERERCRPKYTLTKYPDGGEVYVSEDGQRVAMVVRLHGDRNGWCVNAGDGQCRVGIDDSAARMHAEDYVSGKKWVW
jgi:hypothetical protein